MQCAAPVLCCWRADGRRAWRARPSAPVRACSSSLPKKLRAIRRGAAEESPALPLRFLDREKEVEGILYGGRIRRACLAASVRRAHLQRRFSF